MSRKSLSDNLTPFMKQFLPNAIWPSKKSHWHYTLITFVSVRGSTYIYRRKTSFCSYLTIHLLYNDRRILATLKYMKRDSRSFCHQWSKSTDTNSPLWFSSPFTLLKSQLSPLPSCLISTFICAFALMFDLCHLPVVTLELGVDSFYTLGCVMI